MIVDKLLSFEFNKIKMQFTTPSGNLPAYDLMLDFTLGKMLIYNNLTSECQSYPAPVFDLGSFYRDIVANHTELAGKRGSTYHVYEMKIPQEGSRTWIYGQWVKNDKHKFEIFYPKIFQSHHFEEKADYSGKFIDTIGVPKVTEATFDYPQCKNATELEYVPISMDPMSIYSGHLKRLSATY